jgi:hypothetical protein
MMVGRIGRRTAVSAMNVAAQIASFWRSMDGRTDEQLDRHVGGYVSGEQGSFTLSAAYQPRPEAMSCRSSCINQPIA